RETGGDLAEAAEQYQRAAADAEGKPLVVQAALFGRARALADLAQGDPGRAAEVIAQLQSFARAYPNGRHIGGALTALARLQLQKDDFAGAEQTLAALAKVPQSADRAAVLQAKLDARRGRHEQAIALLDRLIASAPEGSSRHRAALL